MRFVPTIITNHSKTSPMNAIDPTRLNIQGVNRFESPSEGLTGVVNINYREEIEFERERTLIVIHSHTNAQEKNQLKKYDIPHPPWMTGKLVSVFRNMLVEDQQYVIKPDATARSLGKAIVDKNKLIKMFNFIGQNPPEGKEDLEKLRKEFNKKFDVPVGHIRGDDEKYVLYNKLCTHSYIADHFVDIKVEYRVLLANKIDSIETLVIFREGSQIGTKVPQDSYIVETDLIPKDLLKKLHRMIRKEKQPWYSIDVYQDTDGNWGVFEFSEEYSGFTDGVQEWNKQHITDALLAWIYKERPEIKILCELVEKHYPA